MTLDYPVPFHTPNLVWDSTIAIYLFLLGISSGAVQLAIAYKRSNKLMKSKLDYSIWCDFGICTNINWFNAISFPLSKTLDILEIDV